MSGLPGLIRALIPPPAAAPTGAEQPLAVGQLRTLLDVGNVLAVKVLGSIAGRSTIEIGGRPVTATLPEGVAAGDVLQVRVEGFTPNQVLLKLLTVVSLAAKGAPPAPSAEGPPPETAPRSTASIDQPGEPSNPAAASRGSMADGHAVPGAASELPARLAAFRLSTAAGAAMAETRKPAPPLPGGSPPPQMSPPVAEGSGSAVSVQIHGAPVAVPPARNAPGQAAAVALLRSLRLPVTPTTLAAVRVARSGSVQVAKALDTLVRALPLGTSDPRVRYVRAIAEFVGTLDPSRPETLPARIEAYVNHVLMGEAQLRRALAPETFSPATPESAAAPARQEAASIPAGVPAEISAAAAAVAREVADANLKLGVMDLIAGPQAGLSAPARAALQGAIGAIVGAQVQALDLQAATPQMLTIPLPLPFPAGGQQAYLQVARDARRAETRLTAESFHLALVLGTARHGTVAIDVLCADRALSVDVKTERASAATAFAVRLPELGSRLERLSYRVVRLDAAVAPVAPDAPVAAAPLLEASLEASGDRGAGLDLRA